MSTLRMGRINWSFFNKMTTVIFILSLLLWGYMELTDSDRFPINHIQITGTYQHTPHSAIQRALMPHVQTGFFNVSLRQLQHELEKYPWVANVSIQRQWPDTLIVEIQEHEAYCRWNQDVVIATDNTLLEPAAETIPTDLPALQGPPGTQQIVLSMFEQLSHQLAPLDIKIASLTMDNYYTWQMMLDNGLNINLGRDDVAARVSKFVRAYPNVIAKPIGAIEYVDLRYRNGLAIKWRYQNASDHQRKGHETRNLESNLFRDGVRG